MIPTSSRRLRVCIQKVPETPKHKLIRKNPPISKFTRNRREEVGIMKSFGARSVYIIRMLLGEGIVLSTLATLTGCLIYLQYALKEGLYTNIWNEQEILPIYWVNRFPLHFLGVSLIVWIILLIVVSIGIYIPARSISKIIHTISDTPKK